MTRIRAWIACGLWLIPCSIARSERPATQPASSRPAADVAALQARVQPAIDRGLAYLEKEQGDDGGWHRLLVPFAPGISALAVKCFLQDPAYGPHHEVSQRGVRFLLKNQKKDGGIYTTDAFGTYMTSVALMALTSARDPSLLPQINQCIDYLRSNQYDEDVKDDKGKVVNASHDWYGGAGHGGGRRPDLSHTQLMLEALHESGLPADDPVYIRAVAFIERCQQADGGFAYAPGESKAGEIKVDGVKVPRSYGSMTYAAFKSLLYAELKRDDPRVRKAWEWMRKNYTLEANPNMPGRQSKEGLFYFYHAFARAMQASGEAVIVDANGTSHDWRAELCDQLMSLQRRDGSWVNSDDRFAEGDPHLVTAYAILAMQAALQDPPRNSR